MGAQDNHLVAVNAATGKEAWNVMVEENSVCRCGITSAPLFVRGKVITGVAGGSRGYLRAFDSSTGKLVWNFDVIPSPDQPGGDSWPPGAYKTGGGTTWLTGTYDPDLNLIYWGSSDPSPEEPEKRPGLNLYSGSLLALDAESGKLRWYSQETPHDENAFDASMEPVLIDVEKARQKQKLAVHPTKGGFSYVYDRQTGTLLNTFPFTSVSWTKGLDADGKPLDLIDRDDKKDFLLCPGDDRGRGSNHSAYSPRTGWWYSTDMENCAKVTNGKPQVIINPVNPPNIAAFDPLTGKKE